MEYGDCGGYLEGNPLPTMCGEHDLTFTPPDDPGEWYDEYGMDAKVYEPWEFKDRPSMSLHDCVKPAVL